MADYYAMVLRDAGYAIQTGATLYDDDDYPSDDWFTSPAEEREMLLLQVLANLIAVMTPPEPDDIQWKRRVGGQLMDTPFWHLGRQLLREVQACDDAMQDIGLFETKQLLRAAERDVKTRYERVRVI
jgi:hypothetical protein